MKNYLSLLLGIFLLFILASCGGRPKFMKHETFFYCELGNRIDQIGSNIPDLEKSLPPNNKFMIHDYIDVPDSIQIFRNKVYIADKINKKVAVFNLSPMGQTNMIISNIGENYEFDRPFQIELNKYGEIYVVASTTNYSSNEIAFQYYIYKFSIDGDFIYKLGFNGINTEAMPYPSRIHIDQFDNLYVYFQDFDENGNIYWEVKRFSPSGELNFQTDSSYMSMTNTENEVTYYTRVKGIYNLVNDERLLFISDYYVIEKNKKPVPFGNQVVTKLSIYSILQNSITYDIYAKKDNYDNILGITRDDEIVLWSYDEKNRGVLFRFIDIYNQDKKDKIYYAPHLMDYYTTIKYFIDNHGELYSILIKDNKDFVILHWLKGAM